MLRFRKLRAAAKSVGSAASRILEESLPFIFYLIRKVKQERKAHHIAMTGEIGGAAKYHRFTSKQLANELEKERGRATALDEKTFKMTLALGLGLAIVSLTGTFLLPQISLESLTVPVAVSAFLATLYILSGGCVALGALRTHPSYGYGAEFLWRAQKNKTEYIIALEAQKTMNIVRHIRNEAAFQCLRNGAVFLLISLILFAAAGAVSVFYTAPSLPTGGPH